MTKDVRKIGVNKDKARDEVGCRLAISTPNTVSFRKEQGRAKETISSHFALLFSFSS